MRLFLHTASLAALAAAILPDARIIADAAQDGLHSLPNLLKLASSNDLANDWDLRGNIELDAGRLVVRDGPGSLWARAPIPESQDEWTVEVTFRNSEQVDVDDHSYYSTNGLSFWVLDGAVPGDASNFGGPRKFDGFQFLVNNLDYSGVKIFASDGNEVVNAQSAALGGCETQYLDSMVPFTLRLSYSASKNWFKVQIDNKLCFATEALSFKNVKSDLSVGVSASVDAKSQEYWEILKFDVFDRLTDDAKDDHGLAGNIEVTTVTKTNQARPTTNLVRESLMSRMRTGDSTGGSVSDEVFAEITQKLASLESMMDKFDTSSLSSLVQNLQRSHDEIKDTLHEMKAAKSLLDNILEKNQQEVMVSFRNLGRELSEEIKNVKAELKETDTRINTLFKEKSEHDQFKFENFSPDSEVFSVVVKWVFIPFVIGTLALVIVVYRLKKDIKHAKLL